MPTPLSIALAIIAIALGMYFCWRGNFAFLKMAWKVNESRAEHEKFPFLPGSWQAGAVVDAYRRSHPQGGLRRVMYVNFLIGVLFFVASILLFAAGSP